MSSNTLALTDAQLADIAAARGVTVRQLEGILSDLTALLPAESEGLTIGGGKSKVNLTKLAALAGAVLPFLRRRR